MEEIIIYLRKFNLRWAIVIMLLASILTSFSGELLKLSTLVVFLASTLFYATWCAQAVANLKKAYRTLYIIIGTSFLNTVWILLSEPLDAGEMSNLNEQMYMSATYSYPTALLQSLASAVAFIYSFSSVIQKYKLCWGAMIIIFLLSFMNLFVLVTGSVTFGGESGIFYHGVETYINANMIIGVLTLILFIVLFIQGSNNSQDIPEINHSSKNLPYSHSTAANITGSNSDIMKNKDNTELLFKLKELLDAGVLSKEEFESEKAKILNK